MQHFLCAIMLFASVPVFADDWNEVQPVSACMRRDGLTSVVFKGKIWIFGGESYSDDIDDDQLLNDIWSSPDGVNWTLVADNAPWGPRYAHSVTVFGDKLYLAGGWGDGYGDMATGFRNDVWRSPDGVNWTRVVKNAEWPGRTDFSLIAHGNKLYIFGGWDHSSRNDVWSSTNGTTWTLVTPAAPWIGRRDQAALSFNGSIFIYGGESGDAFGVERNDIWTSTNGATWVSKGNAAWPPRRGHVALDDGSQVWIVGGSEAGVWSNQDPPKVNLWKSLDGFSFTPAFVPTINNMAPSDGGAAVLFGGMIWNLAGNDFTAYEYSYSVSCPAQISVENWAIYQ